MDLGMEKGEFIPGKDLAACFPPRWSEMCQGGQGEHRELPEFPIVASTAAGFSLLFSLEPVASHREMNPPHKDPATTVT